MVRMREFSLDPDRLVEVPNGLLILTQVAMREAAVVPGASVGRFDPDAMREFLYCLVEIANLMVGVP